MALSVDMFTSLYVAFASLLFACVFSLARWRLRSHGLPLPPGPTTLPFIGTLLHMRKPEPWKAYRDLCKIYGDVVYVPILGQRIVLLGSPEVIFDLMDKRSAIASDRQQSSLLSLSGQDFNIALMPYGQQWRQHRRAVAQQFTPKVSTRQLGIQWRYARLFARLLLEDPSELRQHVRYTFAASIVKTVYGVDVAEKNDHTIAVMETAIEGIHAFTPGQFLVQHLPFFKHIPTWTPFLGSQMRQLGVWKANADEVKHTLFERTKNNVDNDKDVADSVVGSLLQKMEALEGTELLEQQDIAKNVAMTAFEGAVDTTYATLQFFFLAMSLHPEVQQKAHAELDAVVGPDRLPNHDDRDSLPYLHAVLKETLRWQPIAPAGLPHTMSEDLEYRGYFIPEGTLLLPLTWACLNDPEVYKEPDRFFPERFLRGGKPDPDVRNPFDFAFGYGRRKCPGLGYAEASLFINMAIALHIFDISPPCDEHGNSIVIEPRMTGSLVLYPEDGRCTVKPRSSARETLLYLDDETK